MKNEAKAKEKRNNNGDESKKLAWQPLLVLAMDGKKAVLEYLFKW